MKRGPKPKRSLPTGALWAGFEPDADLTGAALEEFHRLIRALSSVGTLDRTDPRLVEAAAQTHALVRQATAELAKSKTLTLDAANGTPMATPLLKVLHTLTARMRALWRDLGLTPASARLGKGRPDTAGPWAGMGIVDPDRATVPMPRQPTPAKPKKKG